MSSEVLTSQRVKDEPPVDRTGLRELVLPSLAPLVGWGLALPAFYLFTLAVDARDGSMLLTTANVAGPIYLGSLCVWSTLRALRRTPFAILTPYVGLLAQTAVFFGIGPLVYIFGNEDTLTRITTGRMGIGGVELLRTNLLVSVGFASTLLGIVIFTRLRGAASSPPSEFDRSPLSIEATAILFLIAGAIVRYGLSLPSEFGANFVVPGFLRNLEKLLPLGLTLTGYIAVQRGGRWRLVFWLVLVPNLLVAVLQFSKAAVVINLMLPAVGCFLGHRNLRRLGAWAAVTALLFSLMQPLVPIGRAAVIDSGDTSLLSLEHRAEVALDFVAHYGQVGDVDRQGAWTRLAYCGPQAFAMALYDSGYPSMTLRDLWIVFIPRLLWPEKPVGVGPGQSFYEIVTGRRGSFLGLSVYADAYWQGGWTMVVIVSVLMGIAFGWLSQQSLRWFSAGNVLYLPLILLAWQMSVLGPMKYIVNGLFGPMPIYLAYMAIAAIVERLFPRRRAFAVNAT